MKKLTERQNEILEYLKWYKENFGIMPTVRDIGDEFSITPKGAYDHLIALEKKKIILRADGKARSIIINEKNYNPKGYTKALKNFEKHNKARYEAAKAIFTNIKKCIICGTEKNIHKHHEDYSKPSEVLLLCQKHHIVFHSWKRKFAKYGLILEAKK